MRLCRLEAWWGETTFILAFALVITSNVVWPLAAWSGGLRDLADGWLLSPGDLVVILASKGQENAAADNPAKSLAERNGWGIWLGAGHGQLYSLEELPLKAVEGGIVRRAGLVPWLLAGTWERLGAELMVEDTGTVRALVGGNPRAGVLVRRRRWLVEGQSMATSLTTDLEGRFSVGLGSRLTGTVALWLHTGELPRWHGRGGRRTLVEVKVFHPGLGLAVRVDQRGDGVPVLSLEVMGRLTAHLGLGFRVDPETGSLGCNLTVKLGGLWTRSSHLVHPSLGQTHRFHLGAGDPEASAW